MAHARASPYYRFVAFIKGLKLNLLTTEQFQTLVRDAWEHLRRNRHQVEHERHHLDDLLDEKRALYDYWNPQIGAFDIDIPSRLRFKDPQRTVEWEDEYGDYFEYQMRHWDSLFKSCRIDRHLYSQRDQLKLLNELLTVKVDDLEERIGLTLNGDAKPSLQPLATLPDYLKKKSVRKVKPSMTKATVESHSEANSSQLLSKLWEGFKAEKLASKAWTDHKSVRTRDTWFYEFLMICGGDKPADSIDREEAVRILQDTRKIPTYWARRYKDVPLAEVPEDAELLAEKSVEDRMTITSEFFKWLVRCDYLIKSPFDGLKYQAKSQKSYATYSKADLEVLFNLPPQRIARNWQFWIPRLALFTGARQNEIAQLRLSDIRKYQSGEWYISINDEDDKSVKSSAAVRIVPLHPALIENGFLKHVERARQKDSVSLWPDLNKKGDSLGQAVSHYWNDVLKRRHQIPSEPIADDGRRKVFHSLRRVFINNLRDAQVDILTIQMLVGHEPEMLGETKTYLDDVTPATFAFMKTAVSKFSPDAAIDWENPKPI